MTNKKNNLSKLNTVFEPIQGKWKSSIICNLSTGRKRFTQILKDAPGLSHKVLNENLKTLEDNELISKEIFYEYPPRVEYFLTSKGYEYAKVLKQLENLG